MPLDFDEFARDVAKDASTDLVSGLVVAGVKGIFGAARAGLSALAAKEPEPTCETVDAVEELAADTVVNEFLNALHWQDHELACAWCAKALLEHPDRQQMLQVTLEAAAPAAWTYVDIQELRSNQHGPVHVLFDLDVQFDTEAGQEFMRLQVQVRWLGDQWRIWDLAWLEYTE